MHRGQLETQIVHQSMTYWQLQATTLGWGLSLMNKVGYPGTGRVLADGYPGLKFCTRGRLIFNAVDRADLIHWVRSELVVSVSVWG